VSNLFASAEAMIPRPLRDRARSMIGVANQDFGRKMKMDDREYLSMRNDGINAFPG
jgi:hypothetical protein